MARMGRGGVSRGRVMHSKYEPLRAHLSRRAGKPEMLTFEEVEQIVGHTLPPSAHQRRSSFWANDYAGHHPHAQCWMQAGYRVAWVSRDEGIVRFERTH